MPITKSAKKALRASWRRELKRKTQEKVLKTALKKASPKTLPQVFRLIDKAAKIHLIHRNRAARLKSRLARRLSSPKETTQTKSQKPAKKSIRRIKK